VSLFHNKEQYNFVVDSGSTLSWTTNAVLSRMFLQPEAVPTSRIIAGERKHAVKATLRVNPTTGTDEDYTAQKFSATLYCGVGTEKIEEMNSHVSVPIHGILGSDFLYDNSLKVDYSTMTLLA
jgi:hypothetical protein